MAGRLPILGRGNSPEIAQNDVYIPDLPLFERSSIKDKLRLGKGEFWRGFHRRI